MENIKRPGTGWYIGGVTLKENGGTQNEYRIDIVRCGIHIKKNNQMILHLDQNGLLLWLCVLETALILRSFTI